MDFRIIIHSEDEETSVSQAKSLKRWLEDDEIDDLKEVRLKKKELQEDDAAAGLVEGILAVTLGAPAIVALVKALHVWIKEKTKQKAIEKRKLSLTIVTPSGDMININAENIGEKEQEIIAKLSESLAKKGKK